MLATMGIYRKAFADDRLPWRLRGTLGAGVMVSADQTGRLGYDALGLLGDLQLGYVLQPWLDLQLTMLGGAFPTSDKTGGLLAPMFGAALGLPGDGWRPYLQLDVGPGFTGGLARPFFRGSVGVELRVLRALSVGPVAGYGHLFQTNAPGDSTDARFLWLGVVVSLRPAVADKPTSTREHVRWTTVRRTVVEVVSPPQPIAPTPPVAPSAELEALLEQAVPSQRVELLAPILFELDSAELEPVGIAMLHEVARELVRRASIKLLDVQGYADSRGQAAHNLELSERRAARVIEWLVDHGVARERMRIAPRGSSELVEPGSSETDHEQNRRVVFRVVEPEQR
jgi:outer membrane protein OmpA-like peptidoglycan-associated protein